MISKIQLYIVEIFQLIQSLSLSYKTLIKLYNPDQKLQNS